MLVMRVLEGLLHLLVELFLEERLRCRMRVNQAKLNMLAFPYLDMSTVWVNQQD